MKKKYFIILPIFIIIFLYLSFLYLNNISNTKNYLSKKFNNNSYKISKENVSVSKTEDYLIDYNPQQDKFYIYIYNYNYFDAISKARNNLKNILNKNDKQICQLNLNIIIPRYINEELSNDSSSLKLCP
jgi:hypothetical protein